jgi:signal transduction histidine kinase
MSTIRVFQALLGLSALALGVLAYRMQVDNLAQPVFTTEARSLANVAAALAFLVAGLVAWSRRPASRLGPLMVLTCFALLSRQIRYSHDELWFTLFFLFGEVGYVLVAHVALAYPFGRVTDRFERTFLKVSYAVVIAFPLAILLFYDGSRRLQYFDPAPRESLLLVSGNADLVDTLQKIYAVTAYGVLATLFILLIARKLWTATPRARRILAPLLIAAAVAALRAVFDSVLTFVEPVPGWVFDLYWWQVAGLAALPLALLAGLFRARLARVHVGDLVVHLERTPVHGIRDELAHALGDPTLEVAFWLPERREYVDAAGEPFAIPSDGARRAVTPIERDGAPLAILVHDPTLRDEPELLEAVAAAARLALENARLQAELNAQLVKVKESRARIVTAADEERRRIERDIHDGAQQRLVALALELRSTQRRMGTQVDPEVERLLVSASEELQTAVEELRELAHGIHPGILVQGGLATALETLASRSPLPVTVEATEDRLSPEVEGAAYFVASEALANVIKHAQASRAAIRTRRSDGTLLVEVEDDGVGGAAPQNGSGLRGLADRVEALGGRLTVESAPGAGTRVVGEIPCAS